MTRVPSPKAGSATALAVVGAVAALQPAPAEAALSPVTAATPALQARVQAVRDALRLSAPGSAIQPRWPPQQWAQADSWTNWPKWSKWSNWGNK